MTVFDLRSLALRSGEQQRETVEVELEPLRLGGQEYAPAPDPVAVELAVTKASSGTLFELSFEVALGGPCFRCLADAELPLALHAREYEATSPGDDDELRTEYLADDRLDLSRWARDVIALELPDKILCRPDCAGLCPVCGKDLNEEPHVHEEAVHDPRWDVLEALREPESPAR
jgi:uncharacterized protein